MGSVKCFESSEKKTRNAWFDILRIFCCISIIILHASGYINNTSNLWFLIQVVVRPALWTFMALTGYFAFQKPIENFFKYWYSHIIPLITTVVIYLFIYQLISEKTIDGYNPFMFLRKDPIGHLWYIYALIQIYILVPFLKKALDSLNPKQLITLLIAFFIIRRGLELLKNYGVETSFSTEIIGNCSLFYVCLGFYLYKYPLKIKRLIVLLAITFLNYILTFIEFKIPLLTNGLCNLSIPMAVGVICYISIFENISGKLKLNKCLNSFFSFIGKRTFGIYIIHISLLQFLAKNSILSYPESGIMMILFRLSERTVFIFIIGLVFSVLVDGTIVYIVNKFIIFVYNTMNRSASFLFKKLSC